MKLPESYSVHQSTCTSLESNTVQHTESGARWGLGQVSTSVHKFRHSRVYGYFLYQHSKIQRFKGSVPPNLSRAVPKGQKRVYHYSNTKSKSNINSNTSINSNISSNSSSNSSNNCNSNSNCNCNSNSNSNSTILHSSPLRRLACALPVAMLYFSHAIVIYIYIYISPS